MGKRHQRKSSRVKLAGEVRVPLFNSQHQFVARLNHIKSLGRWFRSSVSNNLGCVTQVTDFIFSSVHLCTCLELKHR